VTIAGRFVNNASVSSDIEIDSFYPLMNHIGSEVFFPQRIGGNKLGTVQSATAEVR
jgi:hypothetical protein